MVLVSRRKQIVDQGRFAAANIAMNGCGGGSGKADSISDKERSRCGRYQLTASAARGLGR
jgi:hypothetical protein